MSNKVLNKVVDSLMLRVMKTAPASQFLADSWDSWQQYIEAFEPGCEPFFIELAGVGTFRVMPYRAAPYGLVLDCPEVAHIRVWNAHRWVSDAALNTGQLFVDFRSHFLQDYGLGGVRCVLDALFSLFYADVEPECDSWVRVARADLAVDVQEPEELDYAELGEYVCRARVVDAWLGDDDIRHWLTKDKEQAEQVDGMLAACQSVVCHAQDSMRAAVENKDSAVVTRVVSAGRKLKSVYFGRFGSKLYARRYDKLHSLAKQGKLYMIQHWLNNGWDGRANVTRTEFSVSGDFLREFRCDAFPDIEDFRSLSDFEAALSAIWHYLTRVWLRRVDLGSATRAKRAKLHSSWTTIQDAWDSFSGSVYRDYERSRQIAVDHLYKQARGCLLSAAAAVYGSTDDIERIFNGYDDLSNVIADVSSELMNYLKDDDAHNDIEERLRFMGLDDFTDTALSATVRAERMMLGGGS